MVAPVGWFAVAAAASSAILHIYAEYRGPVRLIYIAKPLTTLLLVAVALLANTPERSYQVPIVAGLLLSLVGDVFLMLPGDHFVAGLVSFLVAHIAYIVAFTSGVGLGHEPLLLLPSVVLASGVLVFLWPRLGTLRLPVSVYVAALVVMAWQASVRATNFTSLFTAAAAAGAFLFVVSDGVLAINRFRLKFRVAQAVIMSTYVAAQTLMALSVWREVG
jgi:uncharacterized membrane protein YhhN